MSSPDPQRLAILTDLRKDAGLTLTQMARRCGLSGKQSHQTAGAWERGVYAPSERRRTLMIGYLWDDLLLRTDPEQFEEVWSILAEEWEWAPVSDEEWRSFTTQIRPGQTDKPARGPFQAPAVPASFTGRTDELAALHHVLENSGSQPIALVGMGGIGKTTMAAHAARQLREHFADGVLWAHTQVSEPVDILNSWAKAYGHDYSGLSDVQSRASAMRNLLANKRTLVVLDDVSSPSRVRPLLPGHAGCAILLTTRSEDVAVALGAHVLRLPELGLESCLALLTQLLGQARLDAEPDAAEEICELLHNLPLAVEIVGQLLAARPRRRLADMAHRLSDAQGRLDLAIADRDVRTSFLVSWDSLDGAHREAFSHMALFEGRSFTAEALAGVLEIDERTAVDRLDTLAARSLVALVEENRYRQHPLLADFALEQLGDASESWMRFTMSQLDFVRRHGLDLDRLEPEWDNTMAAMHAAHEWKNWQTVLDFADELEDPWYNGSNYGHARAGYDWAIAAATHLDRQEALAENLIRSGNIFSEQADYTGAVEYLNRGLALAERLMAPRLIADAEYLLARIDIEHNRLDVAETRLTTCHEIREELEDRPGIILARHFQAFAIYRRGELNRAREYCRQALIFQDEGPVHLGTVRTYRLLADIAIEEKEYELARSMAGQALQAAHASGFQDEVIEVEYIMAVIYRFLGQYVNALNLIEDVVDTFERTGKRAFLSHALYECSVIQKLMGDLDEARTTGEKSLSLLSKDEDDYSRVFYLIHLAEIQKQYGNQQGALILLESSHRLSEKLNHPRQLEIQRRMADITTMS